MESTISIPERLDSSGVSDPKLKEFKLETKEYKRYRVAKNNIFNSNILLCFECVSEIEFQYLN